MVSRKSELLEKLNRQWRASEEACRRAAQRFEDPLPTGEWTVGDAFRHLCDCAYRLPRAIEEMCATGALDLSNTDARNAAGLARFKELDPNMLAVELNTAHGVATLTFHRLSDEDLARPVKVMANESTIGDVIEFMGTTHELNHVPAAR
jgi:hypothetical protein